MANYPWKLRNQILSILDEKLGQSDKLLTSYGRISEKISKSIFGKMHLAYLFFWNFDNSSYKNAIDLKLGQGVYFDEFSLLKK